MLIYFVTFFKDLLSNMGINSLGYSVKFGGRRGGEVKEHLWSPIAIFTGNLFNLQTFLLRFPGLIPVILNRIIESNLIFIWKSLSYFYSLCNILSPIQMLTIKYIFKSNLIWSLSESTSVLVHISSPLKMPIKGV